MELQTCWWHDQFYPHAPLLRRMLDDHFTESHMKTRPFQERTIWNYWYIPTLYAYMRAESARMFGPALMPFMRHLQDFTARMWGLHSPSLPFISMYINGCMQNIHNDVGNGRLAFVYSLTNWEERHFEGGETFVYHVGEKQYERLFKPVGGWGFYQTIEPVFNRLGIFDDRMPHAVNLIRGSMNPHDARFALHGHLEEPDRFGFVEGPVARYDLTAQWLQVKEAAQRIFSSHGHSGFISYHLELDEAGRMSVGAPRLVQLLPVSLRESKPTSLSLDDFQDFLAAMQWPKAEGRSSLVFTAGTAMHPPET